MIERMTEAQLKTLAVVESITDRFSQVTGNVFPAISHDRVFRFPDCSKLEESALLFGTHLEFSVGAKKGSGRCKL